jgi:hypothetical protein
LAGKDPQSEKTFDMGDCSIPWGPVTAIENSQMARQAGASMDKVANQVHELNLAFKNLALGMQNIAGAIVKISEDQKDLIEHRGFIEVPTNGAVEHEQ